MRDRNDPTEDESFPQWQRISCRAGLAVRSGRNPQGIVLVEEILTPVSNAPGYTEVSSLTGRYPQLMSEDHVTLEISPVTPTVPFWAFVSITNNETQHVTTVTPD